MVGGRPFHLAPGEWTDDTSMALCLADTYASQGKFDLATFADAMVRWYRQGENSANGRCFEIGNVTRRALEGWEAQGLAWMGNLEASTAGNGIVDTARAYGHFPTPLAVGNLVGECDAEQRDPWRD